MIERPTPGHVNPRQPVSGGIGHERITCPDCKATFKSEPNLPIQICPLCNRGIRVNTPTYQRGTGR